MAGVTVRWILAVCCLTFHTAQAVTCPSGYYSNDLHGTCIWLQTSTVTWQEARRTCAQLGAQLIRCDSDAMVQSITDLIVNKGIRNRANISGDRFSPCLTQDGEYRHADGADVTYFRWARELEQPNGGVDQRCVIQCKRTDPARYNITNYWEDKHCVSYTGSTVCELWPPGSHAPGDRAAFERVGPLPDTETNLQITQVLETVSILHCAEACQPDPLCDGFAFRPTLPVVGNCLLLTLQEVSETESLALAEKLRGFLLFRITG